MTLGTHRVPCGEDYILASELLRRGVGTQNAALIAGVTTETLLSVAALFGARPARRPTYVHFTPVEAFGPPRPSRTEQIMAVIDGVARRHGLTRKAILDRTQRRHVAYPRHEAMAMVRDRFGLSLPHIGTIFGRHHTTVLLGIRRHEASVR